MQNMRNDDIIISPNMNLGLTSPLEDQFDDMPLQESEQLYKSIMKEVSKTVKNALKDI